MPGSRMLPLALCALLIACRGGERGSAAAADTLSARAAAAAVLTPLAPIRTFSAAEAQYAAQAVQHAAREDVRRYAQVIATDHRALVGILDSVARAQGVGYQATPAARELESAVQTAHAGRDSLTGPAFDLAFIRAEVETYRQLIDRLDQELIPAMGAAPQRALLQDIRTMASAHLTRARQLLAVALREMPAPPVARPATPAAPRPVVSPRPPDTPRIDTLAPPVRRDTIRPPVRPDTLRRPPFRGW